MNPTAVIEALAAGTATEAQREWARRRCDVLTENRRVFGRLTQEEQQQLKALVAGLKQDREARHAKLD